MFSFEVIAFSQTEQQLFFVLTLWNARLKTKSIERNEKLFGKFSELRKRSVEM